MDLNQPQTLKPFLERHGLTAKKGLGQHFLCSSNVVGAIERAIEGSASALEIGPGPGILTGMLCRVCGEVVAIELDERMPVALAESAPCARIIQADALKTDLCAILEPLPQPRALVSNLPYYITGPLLTRIAEVRDAFDVGVFMMQREVGWRVLAAASASERGSLSAFLQVQFQVSKVIDAKAGAFMPPPKVDSVVLKFVPRFDAYPASIERTLFRLIRGGFTQPRKTLANNLMAGLSLDRERAESLIAGLGWDARIRPQQLTNEQWVELALRLEE